MNYCRNPYYIYPIGEGVEFSGTYIEDKQLNVWLYNMLLKNRREELINRIKEGKNLSLKIENPNFITTFIEQKLNTKYISDEEFDKLYYLDENSFEVKMEKEFQERNEDELIKILLNNNLE